MAGEPPDAVIYVLEFSTCWFVASLDEHES